MNNLSHALCQGFDSIIEFVIGFVIGSIIDLLFFRIYIKLDSSGGNNVLLLSTILIQLYFISVTLFLTGSDSRYFLKLGILSSQLFLLKFGMIRIADSIYGRKKYKIMQSNTISGLQTG
jgi:hypothetical protein